MLIIKILLIIFAMLLLLVLALMMIYVAGQIIASIVQKNEFVPFMPTDQSIVKEMLKIANVTDGDTILDIGSGTGHMVITAAAQYKVDAVGIEINPFLVWVSRLWVRISRLKGTVTVLNQDAREYNLAKQSIILTFLTDTFMQKYLVPKFEQELSVGSKIVSYVFRIKSPLFTEEEFTIDRPGFWGKIYLYTKRS